MKTPTLLERTRQLISGDRDTDATLAADLASALQDSPSNAALHNLQGVVFLATDPTNLAKAAGAFQRAWTTDSRHLLAGLNLAEILVLMGQKAHAVEQAQRTLAMLDRLSRLRPEVFEYTYIRGGDSLFNREWVAAALSNAVKENTEAGRAVLKWRLHRLLADVTGDLVHYFESHAARPDLASSKSALGAALVRAQRPAEALPHVRAANRQDPHDQAIARTYFQVLGQLGLTADQQVLMRARQALAKEVPEENRDMQKFPGEMARWRPKSLNVPNFTAQFHLALRRWPAGRERCERSRWTCRSTRRQANHALKAPFIPPTFQIARQAVLRTWLLLRRADYVQSRHRRDRIGHSN